jgi:hypothetical protein
MTKLMPDSWGNDALSTIFQTAENNGRVTSVKFPAVYSLLQRLHLAFHRVQEVIEKDNRPELLPTRFLMIRVHSSLLASMRLAMCGQAPEAYVVLRSAIEQAWYALHIAKDPSPPQRSTIWLSRNDDAASKSRCKTEFTIANVRSTLDSLDPVTSKPLHQLYETMIDFGAHPNQRGVLAAINSSEQGKEHNYHVGILAPEPLPVVSALHETVAVGVGALKVFHLVFPERFQIMGLDSEIDVLVAELNSVFKSLTF